MEEALGRLAAVFMHAQRLASVAIGVRRHGRPDVLGVHGFADLENDVPATAQTVYRIGSLTKTFTAACVMRLVERGALRLDDTLGRLIPQYPAHAHGVTVEQLLTHTSGIKSYTEVPEFAEQSRLDLTHRRVGVLFAMRPLDFPPGERYHYSNSGYYLLGAIIEQVTGLRYHEFLEREILAPLGLKTTYYLDDYRLIKHRAQGYDVWHGHTINAGMLSMTAPFAAGALGSTLGDLLAFSTALVDGRVVSPDSLARMTRPAVLNDGSATTYGYGIVIGHLDGHRKLFHAGTINGFRAQLAVYPEDGVAVVVLSNHAAAAVDLIETRAARLALGIAEPAVSEIDVVPAEISGVVGRYDADGSALEVTMVDGVLQIAGAALRPVGLDEYVVAADPDTHVTFARGEYNRLVIEREGQRTVARGE